ncbi:MAG: indolepyruvate ferredoxin oxidoreductase subunit alpha [Sarcina sp.]
MSIRINKEKCIGCRKCTKICPGNLIYFDEGHAFIKYPKDCWSCASCLKECESEAIELYIPKETGGKEGYITLKKSEEKILWKIVYNGKTSKYETNKKESNKY